MGLPVVPVRLRPAGAAQLTVSLDVEALSMKGAVATDKLPEADAKRLKLATALLSVASEDSRDVQVLKTAALAAMAGDYRWQNMQSPTRQ